MDISIVGIGMGSVGTLTVEAKEAIHTAKVIIGAERLVYALPENSGAARYAAIKSDEIVQLIEANAQVESICVLMSGDVGFYSGAKKLLSLLTGYIVNVLPGISSVQYFAAKLRRPWQDWKLMSAHGKDCDAATLVHGNAETFFLTGGIWTVQALCAQLSNAGLGGCAVTAGENLGSAHERIKTGTATELAQLDFDELAVMLVENPAPRKVVSCGLPDDAFLRGDIPMTKSEVRSVILSKLRLRDTDIIYDVGAGTGSFAVEAALLARYGYVYAIEREPEGCRLIKGNAKKLGAYNLTCIEQEAPDAFEGLSAPDAAFIGGSGGRLNKILEQLLQMNPSIRLTISAVTLETLAEATMAFSRLPIRNVEIVQIAVSRAKHLGEHHLMMAQNPVFIISGVGENG